MPRLNFTGRRRIAAADAVITVTGIGGIETFQADLKLDSYAFPAHAAVFVEAWRQLDLVRFPFGTVGSLNPPEHCGLSDFGTVDGVRFRVKVVSTDPPQGRLLGVADRILPQHPNTVDLLRVPLLPVRSQDLGREIWRLDFSSEPLLLINKRLVARQTLIRSAAFRSLVLPEILRSILVRILLVEQIRDEDDPEQWPARWLRFASSLPGVGRLPSQEDPEQDSEWIDMTIAAFCRWRRMDEVFSEFFGSFVATTDVSADSGSEGAS